MIIPNTTGAQAIVVTFWTESGCRTDSFYADNYTSHIVDIVAWQLSKHDLEPVPVLATTFGEDVYLLHPDGSVESQHVAMFDDYASLIKDLDNQLSLDKERAEKQHSAQGYPNEHMVY